MGLRVIDAWADLRLLSVHSDNITKRRFSAEQCNRSLMNTKNRKFAHPRVLVIGGGFMGLWPAALLAQRGCAVTVLEADKSCTGASWAAAGMLSPASEAGEGQSAASVPDTFGAHSLALWQDWAARFGNAGQGVCWRPFGGLLCAFDDAGLERLERTKRAALALDLNPINLTPDEALGLEPSLSHNILAGLQIANEASVDPRLVLKALEAFLQSAGGAVHYQCRALRIEPHNDALRIICAEGQVFEADRIILAAGFQAGQIDGVGELDKYLHPVKGQMLALETPDDPVRSVIRDERAYIVPRGNGQTIIGATSEPGQDDDKVHAADIVRLHQGAAAVIPALADARRLVSWAGVRPQSIDGLPIIGPLALCGVFANCGHYRNGIVQAPASAAMLCAMILGDDPGLFADAFRPSRFSLC